MKCVSFPLDVFAKFRSADTELADEVFQYVLGYVIDGEQRHFTDTYKEMLFESLLEPIRPQMARYSERAEQCQEMARERMKSQKAPRRKNVKAAKGDGNIYGDSVVATDVPEDATDDKATVLTDNVVMDDEGICNADGNVTSSYDNVQVTNKDVVTADEIVESTYMHVAPAIEDISFAAFMSIYGHQDRDGFDTESVWNRLGDDDKHEAIRFARSYVKQVPDAAKREWPSRFISTRPWAQTKNQ